VGFTAAQAARLTGCSLAQLSSWERSGLIAPPGPTRRYRRQDLVALRVVAALLDAGLGLDRIRRALDYLVEAGADAPCSLVTDGDSVWACRDEAQILDALRNVPVALVVALDRIGADVDAAVRAFDAERQAFVQGLHDAEAVTTDAATSGEAVSGRAGDASARGS
jgi:DNA-binding transcriptional MerR regulator